MYVFPRIPSKLGIYQSRLLFFIDLDRSILYQLKKVLGIEFLSVVSKIFSVQ